MPRKKLDKPNFKLTRRKDKPNWWVSWTVGGKPQRISTGTEDETAAYSFLIDFKSGWESPPEKEYQTVNVAIDAYLAYKKNEYQLRGDDIHHYRSTYKILVAAFIKIRPFFGNIKLNQLTRQLGRDYIEKRKKDTIRIQDNQKIKDIKSPSNATIAREIAFLNAALNHIKKEGWVGEIPTFVLPPSTPPREKVMTPVEVKRLLAHVDAPHLKTFVLLALHTLARKSAILQLKWSQVDMKNRLIDFNTIGRIRTTKRRAVVPINNILYIALEEALEMAQSDYVIEYHSKPVIDIKGAFNNAAKKAGISDVTPHTIRHTGATLMALNGVPLYLIAGIMEDSIDTVTKHYAKYQPEYLKEASRKLEEIYG